jgi:hypothetical protein
VQVKLSSGYFIKVKYVELLSDLLLHFEFNAVGNQRSKNFQSCIIVPWNILVTKVAFKTGVRRL